MPPQAGAAGSQLHHLHHLQPSAAASWRRQQSNKTANKNSRNNIKPIDLFWQCSMQCTRRETERETREREGESQELVGGQVRLPLFASRSHCSCPIDMFHSHFGPSPIPQPCSEWSQSHPTSRGVAYRLQKLSSLSVCKIFYLHIFLILILHCILLASGAAGVGWVAPWAPSTAPANCVSFYAVANGHKTHVNYPPQQLQPRSSNPELLSP